MRCAFDRKSPLLISLNGSLHCLNRANEKWDLKVPNVINPGASVLSDESFL